jgi:hypothetical protein
LSTSEHQEQDETLEDDYEDDGESGQPVPMDEEPDGEGPSDAQEAAPVAQHEEAAESETEEYVYEEVGVDGDHRVAQLRKLKYQFGDDMSLTNATLTMEDSGPSLIVCPNPSCNSEEIRGQKFCSQCNARLPQLPLVEQKYNPGSIDGAARKYYDSINKFQAGHSTLDEFVDFLTHGLEKVRAHAEHLADLSADGVIADWLPEAAALISNATKLWYESVESMLIRVEDCQVEFEEEEAMLEELDEEELAEREPPIPLDDRVRMLDFTPELDSIFRSNDQMLEYLRIVDASLKTEAKVGGMQF